MTIIDITRTIRINPEPSQSSNANDSDYATSGAHMGTHAVAFRRFLKNTGETIDKMPLEPYCGNCRVITVDEGELVTLEGLRGRIAGAERLLLHTGGSAYLCEEAAEYIASCGVKTLVTDALSVAPPDNEQEIHSILFNAGVAVIENAVLDRVEDGEYLLFAFPMKYGGRDDAPVRAVLITE